jgi:hypothetical protein
LQIFELQQNFWEKVTLCAGFCKKKLERKNGFSQFPEKDRGIPVCLSTCQDAWVYPQEIACPDEINGHARI